jgi:hypothetical protein
LVAVARGHADVRALQMVERDRVGDGAELRADRVENVLRRLLELLEALTERGVEQARENR